MKHVWLFDVGNSRFKFAPLIEGRVGCDVVAYTYPENHLYQTLEEILPTGDFAYLASVAPADITQTFIRVLQHRFTFIERVITSAHFGGIVVAYPEPERLGVDRFLALLAAHRAEHVLVVGVGTALTIDLLTAQGRHLGGRISASPTLMRVALHGRAKQLPETGGQRVFFATNTEDALASGCEGASIAIIKESLTIAKELIDAPIRLVLHGGGAMAIMSALSDAEYHPSLVLDGLAIWAASHSHG